MREMGAGGGGGGQQEQESVRQEGEEQDTIKTTKKRQRNNNNNSNNINIKAERSLVPKPKTETECSRTPLVVEIEQAEACLQSNPLPVPLQSTLAQPSYPFPLSAFPFQTLKPEPSLPMKWRSVSTIYSSPTPSCLAPSTSPSSSPSSSRSLSSSPPRFCSRSRVPSPSADYTVLQSPRKQLDNGLTEIIHDSDGDDAMQMSASRRRTSESIQEANLDFRKADCSNQHCRFQTTTFHNHHSEEEKKRIDRNKRRICNTRPTKKRRKKDQAAIRLKIRVSDSEALSAKRMRYGDEYTGSNCIAGEQAEPYIRLLPFTTDYRTHQIDSAKDVSFSDMEASRLKDFTELGNSSLHKRMSEVFVEGFEEAAASDSGESFQPGYKKYAEYHEIGTEDMVENNHSTVCSTSYSDSFLKEKFPSNNTVQSNEKSFPLHPKPMPLGPHKFANSDVIKDNINNYYAAEFKQGEVKHFYTRRHKQSKTQESLSSTFHDSHAQRNASSLKSPRNHRKYSLMKEDFNDQRLLSLNKKSGSPGTGNANVSGPLAIPRGSKMPKQVLTSKSISLSTASTSVSRELMKLVSNDCVNPEVFDLNNSFSVSARKKRKLQKTSNAPSIERLTNRKARQFHKEGSRKWRSVNVEYADPTSLVGFKCKIYWPDDKDWYSGEISSFDSISGTHHIKYADGETEDLILSKELLKLYLSHEDMVTRNIVPSHGIDESKKCDYQEMAALASVMDNFQEEFCHGELVWAKIKGHPMWPAYVMDEKHANACGLDKPSRECTLPVQFFGSYDYARITYKQALAFSVGLSRKLYQKCKKVSFEQGLAEAERYMKEGKLPEMMNNLQRDVFDSTSNVLQVETCEGDEDCMGDERIHKTKKSVQSLLTCPINLGELRVLSLGKIVRDSEHFHSENHIWTEGYTAIRKFPSIKDPQRMADYKMEVTKDPQERTKPLFLITLDDGELVEGSTPSMCWRTVYQKLEKTKEKLGLQSEKKRHHVSSGDVMFGFANPQVSKLIQSLPYARACFKFTGWFDKKGTDYVEQLMPAGYKPVEVDWKHADRCSVCGLDEEYTTNLFLQCDKCRVLVHMFCYGESEPPNGRLWLCQLCRQDGPVKNPLCCLCPVQGGAMKRTTDGRLAHLTCAMWIPETCFVDVKHMEPIDGLRSINKERWKLICSICKVPYGVCIQCSDPSCYVAYHVLCARSSGYVLEVLEDPTHKQRGGTKYLEHSLRLISYCRRHRQPKVNRDTVSRPASVGEDTSCIKFCPPPNKSGCARTEPYNCSTRRGRQEPEMRAAASTKRLYVEKMPYRVSGFCRNDKNDSNASLKFAQYVSQTRQWQKMKIISSDTDLKTTASKGDSQETIMNITENVPNICSVSDRYQLMRSTLKLRLAFGKSAIHGWGVFTKQSHRAGDMVIEYAGEIVRPIVADLRERLIYNTLVGAGTYMFRIDDERVVDATRAGSIAHLINHSCQPNCFSRVVTINGEEHIIIFAKRDIEEGEELSYDYRFASKGEQLECFCGFPSCRGFVNLDEGDEENSRIRVPTSEITTWIPPNP